MNDKQKVFHINGRYTLRGINGSYYIYDRETQALVPNSPSECTFTKAKIMLENYKTKENMKA